MGGIKLVLGERVGCCVIQYTQYTPLWRLLLLIGTYNPLCRKEPSHRLKRWWRTAEEKSRMTSHCLLTYYLTRTVLHCDVCMKILHLPQINVLRKCWTSEHKINACVHVHQFTVPQRMYRVDLMNCTIFHNYACLPYTCRCDCDVDTEVGSQE